MSNEKCFIVVHRNIIYYFQNITSSDEIPCCRQCSCRKDCVYTANCCPDAPVQLTSNQSAFPCLTTFMFVHERRPFKPKDYYYIPSASYRFIDKCPTTELNETLVNLCSNPQELSDVVVVTSKSNGLTYGNRYCALCHGQNDVHSWVLHVNMLSCPRIHQQKFKTFQARDEFVWKFCSVNLLPPQSLVAKESRCFSTTDMINDCNKTGLWKVYDKNIEQACLSNANFFTDQFMLQYRRASSALIFRNIYCYQCNLDRKEVSSGLCSASLLDISYDKAFMSFLLIIDMYRPKLLQDCQSFEIYDPLLVCNFVLNI